MAAAAAAAAAAAGGTGGARVLVLEDDGEDDPPVGPAAPERKSDALSFTFQWDTGLTETPIPVPVTVQNVTCNLALSTNVDLNTAEARWFPKHRVYFEVPDLKKTAAVKTKYGAVNVKISPKGKIAMSGKLCGQTWRQDILHAQEVIVDCIHLLGIHPTITDGPTVEAQFCAKFPCKFDIAAVCSKPGVSHIGPLANPKSGSWTLKQPVAVLQFLRTGLVKCRAASEEDCQTALAFAMPQMADCIEQGSLQVGADDGDDDDDDDDKDKDEDDEDDDDEESPSKRARGTPGMGAPSPAMGGMPALALPISGAGFSGAWPMM